jgi:cell division protein YceG involved in septum cleavage
MSALLPQSKSVLTIDYMNPVFAILKKLEQQNIISSNSFFILVLALALKKNI